MPAQLLNIYRCRVCGIALSTGVDDPAPLHCGAPMQWKQLREFKPEQHGWSTGQKSAAIGFRHTSPWVVPMAGSGPNGQREVTSLREIRRIESESAKMAADGVGQEVRFRAFNQDTENGGMLTNSFGAPPQRAPKLYDAQGRQKISFQAVDGEAADADELGPGTREELMSALPMNEVAPGE